MHAHAGEAPLRRPKIGPQTEDARAIQDWKSAGADTLRIIPVPRLYAGGGASAHDPGIAPMRPAPFATFHPEDAQRLGVADGDTVRLCGPGGDIQLQARIGEQAGAGIALVLADMPEAPVNRLLDASGFGTATVTVRERLRA
jgi:hypothetical protein